MTDDRTAFLMQLGAASRDLAYAPTEFNKHRGELGRRAMQTAEDPHLRSAMTDLGFVQAYLNQTAEAKVRLETAIERLKLVHLIGTESMALTAAEFTATTGLDAGTYEKAVAK